MKGTSVEGPAPNERYSIRRSWGKENLRHHFVSVEKWIHESGEIENDIGKVIGVAPIGSPNSYFEGFSESWARMNLQIIGEKGEGVLCLPDVCADDPNHLSGVELTEKSWTYKSSEKKQ